MSGRSYEHRRQWIVDKLHELSAVFAVDICADAVMSNHYHVLIPWPEKPGDQPGRDAFAATPARFVQ